MGTLYTALVKLTMLFGIVQPTTYIPEWPNQSGYAYAHISDCNLNSIQRVSSTSCEADIFCPHGTSSLLNTIKSIHCKPEDDEYEEHELDKYHNYILLTINSSYQHFRPFEEIITFGLQDNIKSLNVLYCHLHAIPDIVYTLPKLTEVTLVNNEINTTNINSLLVLKDLTSINMSHNSISKIDTDFHNTETKQEKSLVTTIDLSYNSIEYLRNRSFVFFPEMKSLNLSNNLIRTLDVLVFDGLSQLQTLYMSNNKLGEIGQILAGLPNVNEVTLDYNYLTLINTTDFNELKKLQKLNVSHNIIKYIENDSFSNLTMLLEVDLSFNQIAIISKTLFKYNNKLHLLSLKNNIIEIIEPGTFEGKNISSFYVDNNCLTGVLEKDTFRGTHINSLDLSQGKITTIGSDVFSLLHLRYLNLSSNLISSVSKSAFHSLKLLETLDISNNNINEVEVTYSTDLLSLNIGNNSIRKISRNMFKNLTSLQVLDLSRNLIFDIETDSFKDLPNLEMLLLYNNRITKNIPVGTFHGLVSLKYLDLSYNNITSLRNGFLSGLKSLDYFNSSHCQIKDMEYKTFGNSQNIQILDLSYNSLEKFLVNKTDIQQVKSLYLDNNKITNISKETFSGMMNLNELDLAHNNILQIDKEAFTLNNLVYLDLQSNTALETSAESFDNLILDILMLSNIKKKFDFGYVTNTSVEYLDLSKCRIEDLNVLNIYKIKNVHFLLLHTNLITSIDKKSFQNMSSLIMLDLSFNSISYIQPGTFIWAENMTTLNLHGNNISKLEYGVFEGLKNLMSLNLSSNMIHNFGVNNIRNLPSLNLLALDDNLIEDISFAAFISKGIQKITVGGNLIPCHMFTELHRYPSEIYSFYSPSRPSIRNFEITAEILDYHSENIDGIRCKATPELSPYRGQSYGNSLTNLTSVVQDIRDILSIIINKTLLTHDSDAQNFVSGSNDANFNDKIDRILKIEKLIGEVKNTLKHNDTLYSLNNSNNDIEYLLYFIVICLVIILMMIVSVFVYKFLRKRNFIRQRSLHNSTQLLSNGIEME